MTLRRTNGGDIPAETVSVFLNGAVGKVFKILPIREQECPSLGTYIESLQDELLGFMWYIGDRTESAQVLSVISILQFLRDAEPDVHIVKREVFKAIGILKRLDFSFEGEGGV